MLLRSGCSAIAGRAVGAIVNNASVDAQFRHLADALAASARVKLMALFGPEHGVRGDAQYMEVVGHAARDEATGVPIYSLYGATASSLSPPEGSLSGIDALVFDLQDVGARYYTYVATMGLAMRAAAKANIAFVVLDRPNPLGLSATEGNLVRSGFRSFVGQYPVLNRHGMTAGELAKFIRSFENLDLELTVVRCEGLTRRSGWPPRAFVAPSPNIPTLATALVYPGMCLLEGTNLSEGRGTCQPFECFGAPFLRADSVAAELNALALPGVRFRPHSFTPTFDKFQGQRCHGAFLHITAPGEFRPVRTGLAIIATCRALGRAHFGWRTHAYEFVDDVPAFDLLCGTDEVRENIEAGASLARMVAPFEGDERTFEAIRARHAEYE